MNARQRLKRNERKRERNRRKRERIVERQRVRTALRKKGVRKRIVINAVHEEASIPFHNPYNYTHYCVIMDLLRPDQITLIAERMALKHIQYNILQARRDGRLIDFRVRAEVILLHNIQRAYDVIYEASRNNTSNVVVDYLNVAENIRSFRGYNIAPLFENQPRVPRPTDEDD